VRTVRNRATEIALQLVLTIVVVRRREHPLDQQANIVMRWSICIITRRVLLGQLAQQFLTAVLVVILLL
jgi:hypothetical protein